MKAEPTQSQRRAAILHLLQSGHATLRTITEHVQRTQNTVRKDLLALEERGYVRVEHGARRCHEYHFVPP